MNERPIFSSGVNPEDIRRKTEESRTLTQKEIDVLVSEYGEREGQLDVKNSDIAESNKNESSEAAEDKIINKEKALTYIAERIAEEIGPEGKFYGRNFLGDVVLSACSKFNVQFEIDEEIDSFARNWEKKIRSEINKEKGSVARKKLIDKLFLKKKNQIQNQSIVSGIIEKIENNKVDVKSANIDLLIENILPKNQEVDRQLIEKTVRDVKDIIDTVGGYFSEKTVRDIIRLIIEDGQDADELKKLLKRGRTQDKIDIIIERSRIEKLSLEERQREAFEYLTSCYFNKKKCNVLEIADDYFLDSTTVREFAFYIKEIKILTKEIGEVVDNFFKTKERGKEQKEKVLQVRRDYLSIVINNHRSNIRKIKDNASIKEAWEQDVVVKSSTFNRIADPMSLKFNGIPYKQFEKDVKDTFRALTINKKEALGKSDSDVVEEIINKEEKED